MSKAFWELHDRDINYEVARELVNARISKITAYIWLMELFGLQTKSSRERLVNLEKFRRHLRPEERKVSIQ
jgi:hypothetical protein